MFTKPTSRSLPMLRSNKCVTTVLLVLIHYLTTCSLSLALAIVDDEGCLVDVLSVSDLRLLGKQTAATQKLTTLRPRYEPNTSRYANR